MTEVATKPTVVEAKAVKALTDSELLSAVYEIMAKPEQRRVLDFYCQNKDRIKMNEQTLRILAERAMAEEEAAKHKAEVDKKVEVEVAVQHRNEVEAAKAREAEELKVAKIEAAKAEAEAKDAAAKEAKDEAEKEENIPYRPAKK